MFRTRCISKFFLTECCACYRGLHNAVAEAQGCCCTAIGCSQPVWVHICAVFCMRCCSLRTPRTYLAVSFCLCVCAEAAHGRLFSCCVLCLQPRSFLRPTRPMQGCADHHTDVVRAARVRLVASPNNQRRSAKCGLSVTTPVLAPFLACPTSTSGDASSAITGAYAACLCQLYPPHGYLFCCLVSCVW